MSYRGHEDSLGDSGGGSSYRGRSSYRGSSDRGFSTYRGSNYRGSSYRGGSDRGSTSYHGSNYRGTAHGDSSYRGSSYRGYSDRGNYRGSSYRGSFHGRGYAREVRNHGDAYHLGNGDRSPRTSPRHEVPRERIGLQDPSAAHLLNKLDPTAQKQLTKVLMNMLIKSSDKRSRDDSPCRERDSRSNFRSRDLDRETHGRFSEGGLSRYPGQERRPIGERQYEGSHSRGHREPGSVQQSFRSGSGDALRHRESRFEVKRRTPPVKQEKSGNSSPFRKRSRLDGDESIASSSRIRNFHPPIAEIQQSQRINEHKSSSYEPRSRELSSDKRSRDECHREFSGHSRASAKAETVDDESGMQVTIKSDGSERAVNNEGVMRPRLGERVFVDLKCPHCPEQRSITFKEYKFHLTSRDHHFNMTQLVKRHSLVLRKIRQQQRLEQRDIDAQWKESHADEFNSAITRFCHTCKLAFKCSPSNAMDDVSKHNHSKMHRMQRHYLHPRCSLCHLTFPSRMVYEHHMASILHLRAMTPSGSHGKKESPEGESKEEGDQLEESAELDLANFMTLDSVGDEEVEDSDLHSENDEIMKGQTTPPLSPSRGEGEEPIEGGCDDLPLTPPSPAYEVDFDDDPLEEFHEEEEAEDDGNGNYFIEMLEVYYCSLCHKAMRSDTELGEGVVRLHCKSQMHMDNVQRDLQHEETHEDDHMHNEVNSSGDDPIQIFNAMDKGLAQIEGMLVEMEAEKSSPNNIVHAEDI